MLQTRIERLARFFPDPSDLSSIDLTDELALDQAHDVALEQIRRLARNGAGLQELIAMENLARELATLLEEAAGEDVEHARRVDFALRDTNFEYASGRLRVREHNGFAWLFPMPKHSA